MSPALAGGFLTTVPPGKSHHGFLKRNVRKELILKGGPLDWESVDQLCDSEQTTLLCQHSYPLNGENKSLLFQIYNIGVKVKEEQLCENIKYIFIMIHYLNEQFKRRDVEKYISD